MRRVVFDVRSPTWTKFGVVVFVASDEDFAAYLVEQYPGGVATVTSDRPATAQELTRRAEYDAWQARWQDAARLGRAGWHMAHPGRQG